MPASPIDHSTHRSMVQLGPASLKRRDIVRTTAEYDVVRANARKHVGRYIVLQVCDAPDDHVKIGLICSKRVHKRAVRRNRARRMMRESYRLLRPGITRPVWMVAIARKRMLDRSAREVQADLLKLFKRAGILADEASA